MKNGMTLFNGVKIEFTENGVNVIATDGEMIRFDDDGKLLRKEVFCRAESFIEYFDFMGPEERQITKEWYINRKKKKIKKDKENVTRKKFFELLESAIEVINEDYYIANIEPSLDENRRIYYKEGEEVARGLSCNEWVEKAREFAPEWESDLASEYQLVLWYAYRIAKGFWTIEYVCDDSSSAGNYWNSPNAAHVFEVSGARKVGGARDGVGNTCKIVTDGGAGFGLFGGGYFVDGGNFPVADVYYIYNPDYTDGDSSGVLVLKKVRSTEH